jgi:hypothetical protein
MLKKLLYLYNDGHIPFPSMGQGGLGYKPQQYNLHIHGDGFNLDTLQFDSDDDMDSIEASRRNDILNSDKDTRRLIRSIKRPSEEVETPGFEFIEDEETDAKNAEEIVKHEILSLLESMGENTDKHLKKIDPKKVERNEKKFLKNILKKSKELNKQKEAKEEPKLIPTSSEDSYKILYELKDRYGTLGSKKNPTFIKMHELVLKNNPYITYEEFMKDVSGYAKGTTKQIKEEKKEKTEEKSTTRAVNKMFNQGDEENRGTAFERVMINERQDELKEFSESKEDFGLCADNPKFLNDNGDPLLVKFQGRETPLSKLSLYDLSNPSSVKDCKYYPEQDYSSIQISKLEGSKSFIPCWKYNKKEDKYTLYNIWCKDINDWLEPENNKEVSIFSILDDKKKYNWSISKLINNWEKSENGENGCPMKLIEIKNKKYFVPDAHDILSALGKKTYTKKGNNHIEWFDVLKNEMEQGKIKQKSKSKLVKHKNI